MCCGMIWIFEKNCSAPSGIHSMKKLNQFGIDNTLCKSYWVELAESASDQRLTIYFRECIPTLLSWSSLLFRHLWWQFSRGMNQSAWPVSDSLNARWVEQGTDCCDVPHICPTLLIARWNTQLELDLLRLLLQCSFLSGHQHRIATSICMILRFTRNSQRCAHIPEVFRRLK